MGISDKTLSQFYEDLRETILSKLKESETLSSINSVVYGEKQNIGSLHSPAIWVVPEPHQPVLKGGRSVEHDFTFDFVVLVKGNKPQENLKKAELLAMDIYELFIHNRTLDGLVSDIRPNQIDPAYEAGNNTQLYWSAVQLSFRVQRR